MTDLTATRYQTKRRAHLAARHSSEKRFRLYCIGAVLSAVAVLGLLLSSIVMTSLPAFTESTVRLELQLNAPAQDRFYSDAELADVNWRSVVSRALYDYFPEVTARQDKRSLVGMLSLGATDAARDAFYKSKVQPGDVVSVELPLSDDIDLVVKGIIDRTLPENERIVSDQTISWLSILEADGLVERRFALALFVNGDSREPEMAGIKGALIGTLWTMLVTLAVSLPIGIMAAIYLQELAPKNRFTDMIEVNISNLAAVPSIVFGLLGLAVFINFLDVPRSSPLVGGLVLALMTFPTIIIATRAALASVPPSIREAALGVGASPIQVITHHVLPLAMPGILTGTIIGLAQAAGETAPLLMVGMMAFIVDTPTDITANATVLPAQIYMWANNPERAFLARTSAAILVLLVFLLFMNAIAIYLRKKFERRW
ncbi:phosphate ABC transporter permease PstA [Alphaproteobacteria bacterium]|nr:phosphate ABC transporter permease PstA [Alphaproteobacteria bacterium]